MTKAPLSKQNSKTQSDNTKCHQHFDYTTIADRLSTEIWVATANQLYG